MATTSTTNTYVGDGSTRLYSFTFPYIEVPDVKVSLDSVETTEFTFANATTIQFNSPPISGVEILIFRVTDNSDPKAVFFPGSAIRARDLNDNFTQSLYVVQEAEFTASTAEGSAAEAAQSALEAKAAADQASIEATEAKDEADQAQQAAAAAQNTADAIALEVVGISDDAEAAQASANQAQLDAEQAAVEAASAQAAAAAAQAAAEAVEDAVIDGGVISVNGQSGVVNLSLTNLTDVDTSSADHVPTNGQSLVWNESMGHWMPSDASLIIGSLPTLP